MTAPHLRDAIAAARTARADYGLGLEGPVHDLLVVVEETADLPVAILPLGSGVAGAYLVRRGEAFVFLNGSEDVARQRFTLAHELGHHRLGHSSVVDGVQTIDGGSDDPKEEQANRVAGEFLAPEPALRRWMEANDDPPLDLEVVVRIARWFGISCPAAVVRLAQADILQRPADRRRLETAIKRGTHQGIEKVYAREAAEDALARIASQGDVPRLPARMRKNALAAHAGGLIDLERLATLLRRDVGTLALSDRIGGIKRLKEVMGDG